MKQVYVIEGARTPFGTFGGSLRNVEVTELGKTATVAALERSGVSADMVDQTFFGTVIFTSPSSPFLARHISLKSGIPKSVPALTVNRLCGSGLQAVVSGVQSILSGESTCVVAGGAENMSQSPHVAWDLRFNPIKKGIPRIDDVLELALTDVYAGVGMGITAENLAKKYNINRKQQEEYALLSQMRVKEAMEKRIFEKEIVPVTDENGTVLLDRDEYPRPNTTLESLAKLRPAFKKDGEVTAGTSSGINDGAATVVLGDGDFIEQNNVKPLARVVSWGVVGVDPNYMGIGPVPAIKLSLERANLTMDEIDLIEVNEAFAVQVLAVQKELNIDIDKLNVNGGAIALGHPVGASGARLLLTLAYELKSRNKRYGIASLCIGGGQGIAMLIENVTN